MSESEEQGLNVNLPFKVVLDNGTVVGAADTADHVLVLLGAIFERSGYDLNAQDEAGTVIAEIYR